MCGRWPEALALPEAGGRARGARARIRLRDRTTSRSSASRTFSATGWCGRAARRAGRRISSPKRRASSAGDLVVHVDHGIGRFIGSEDHRGGGRAARLPRNALCRRRQAVPAGGEHRASVALRLGGNAGRARPARRRRLADAQGADEEPHPRDRARTHQDRGRAADCARRRSSPSRPALYDEFCAGFPVRGDRGPAGRDRRRRSTISAPAARWTG